MGGCEVCKIIWEEGECIHDKRYKFFLTDGWALNHCADSNAYLGYVFLTAAQTTKTKPHAYDFDSLRLEQRTALGEYLSWIQSKLKEFWKSNFQNDEIEQVYFAYFNESPYKKLCQKKMKIKDVKNHLHVHFHILPRTKSMRKICNGEMLGWDLLKIAKTVKQEYLYDLKNKKKLMLFLKKEANKDEYLLSNPK